MSETTGIGWTDSTWTPIQAIRRDTGKRGCACVKISPGCKNCYSETMQLRNLPTHGTGLEFTVLNMAKLDIVINEEILLHPLKWKKPRMIFVCSQTDLFGEFVTDEQIDRVFAVMALCPQHTFQVLTKRADRMAAYFGTGSAEIERAVEIKTAASLFPNYPALCEAADFMPWPYRNIWLGISAENQEWADKRIPDLLNTPAAKRFVSIEPLLGPVDASSVSSGEYTINALRGEWLRYHPPGIDHGGGEEWIPGGPKLDWVIVGGESGHGARPCRVEWIESIVDQCREAGVSCFVKQLGSWPVWASSKSSPIEPARGKCDKPEEWPESLRVQQFPAPRVGGAA
jgi:protein gp37